MIKFVCKTILILPLVILLSSCEGKSKKQLGGEIGMGLGAVAGLGLAAVAGDDGLEAGVAIGYMAGAIVGGIIGSAIGEYLDEVDQLKADMAALTALKASDLKPVKWTSKDNANVSGEAMVVSKNKPGNCKTVKHILNINGKEVFEEQQYCLESDGSWVLQS